MWTWPRVFPCASTEAPVTPLTVVTGGPGCGKTDFLRWLSRVNSVSIFEHRSSCNSLLASGIRGAIAQGGESQVISLLSEGLPGVQGMEVDGDRACLTFSVREDPRCVTQVFLSAGNGGRSLIVDLVCHLVWAGNRKELVLLDCPEKGLHRTLLRALARAISFAVSSGSYVVAVTHSEDLIVLLSREFQREDDTGDCEGGILSVINFGRDVRNGELCVTRYDDQTVRKAIDYGLPLT